MNTFSIWVSWETSAGLLFAHLYRLDSDWSYALRQLGEMGNVFQSLDRDVSFSQIPSCQILDFQK